jgi:hypothetical protein
MVIARALTKSSELSLGYPKSSYEIVRALDGLTQTAAVPAAAVTAAVAAGLGGSLMAFCLVPLCQDCVPLREGKPIKPGQSPRGTGPSRSGKRREDLNH